MTKTTILKLSAEGQNEKIILLAAEIIKKGGILSFPTETVYALGADAMNRNAVKRIYRLKKRDAQKPIAIFISELGELKKLVKRINSPAKKLMEYFWPGPLTLIFKSETGELSHLTGKEEKLGIRVSSSSLVRLLLSHTKTPITATSANLSGAKEALTADEVVKNFKGKIELILDKGPAEEAIPSSVVDVSQDIPILIREGRISFDEIKRVVPELKVKK